MALLVIPLVIVVVRLFFVDFYNTMRMKRNLVDEAGLADALSA